MCVCCDYSAVADPPTNITLRPLNSTAIQLSWLQLVDENVPGMLEGYLIKYFAVDGVPGGSMTTVFSTG